MITEESGSAIALWITVRWMGVKRKDRSIDVVVILYSGRRKNGRGKKRERVITGKWLIYKTATEPHPLAPLQYSISRLRCVRMRRENSRSSDPRSPPRAMPTLTRERALALYSCLWVSRLPGSPPGHTPGARPKKDQCSQRARPV